jgi:hypothetical protein
MAVTCGPPIMITFVLKELEKLRFAPEEIITTLEGKMKCGLAKGGRSAVGELSRTTSERRLDRRERQGVVYRRRDRTWHGPVVIGQNSQSHCNPPGHAGSVGLADAGPNLRPARHGERQGHPSRFPGGEAFAVDS